MSYPEIQSYIGPSTPVDGVSREGMMLDTGEATPVLYPVSADNPPATWAYNGIRRFEVNSGSQTDAGSFNDLYGAGSPYYILPTAIGFDGKITSANLHVTGSTSGFALINPATFTVVATYNQDGLASKLPRRAGLMATASVAGKSYTVVTTPLTITKAIYVMETHGTTLIFAGHEVPFDEVQAAPGQTIDASGIVYTIGFGPNSNTVTPIGLYKTHISAGADGYNPASWPASPNANISTTKMGTFAPSAVDATWSHFYNASAPGYDESDGNLLVFVSTGDAVTHKLYLVKLNASNATVMWATPIAGSSVPLYPFSSHGRITDGLFAHVYTNVLYQFDTSDGSITSQTTLNGVTATVSTYDGDTKSVFCFGSYTGSTVDPTPTTGTGSFSGQWFRLTLGPIAPPLAGSDEGWFAVLRAVTP